MTAPPTHHQLHDWGNISTADSEDFRSMVGDAPTEAEEETGEVMKLCFSVWLWKFKPCFF